jgi:Ni,Fe-hydrogenase I small subunit
MRITRREFMKYCAAAAGALGLTTTDLVKLEKAMASNSTQGGTQVIWLNGAACTGCTVSLANSASLASIQDLLVPWSAAVPAIEQSDYQTNYNTAQILGAVGHGVLTDTGADGDLDIVFMETLSSAVGSRALNAAKTARSTAPYVLAIEGAIQTGSNGNFCKIGDGTDANDLAQATFQQDVIDYATHSNCVAILAVGTCASFGGIPAAKGSVTGARGLISTGSFRGAGYGTVNNQGLWDLLKATKTGFKEVSRVSVTLAGTGYTTAPTVVFTPVGPGSGATAVASLTTSHGVAYISVTSHGSGYTVAPTISIPHNGTETGTAATATAIMTDDYALSSDEWTSLMQKTVCVSGCPPHPDWIVGTIVYILTYGNPPLSDKYHRPFDYYGEYQCTNCQWKVNDPSQLGQDNSIDYATNGNKLAKGGAGFLGNSPKLFKSKYDSIYEGCLGVMGCKGRKTKADCSYRRWNADAKGTGGTGWCVQTRAGCHGCTDPRFPDAWGKFFSFK